jgi:hypothetical protein
MKTIKDYSIIETEWLNERIQIVIESRNFHSENGYSFEMVDCINELRALQLVKSKLKPLAPIVENAFRQGERYGRYDIKEIETGEKNLTLDLPEYINNTIIE